MQRKAVAALVAALALAPAGCGESRTTTVGRTEAVKRLEAACRAGTREAEKVFRAGHGKATTARALRTNLRTIDDGIGDLETTGAARADFDAYKQTVRTRLDAFAKIIDAGVDDRSVVDAERPVIDSASRKAYAAIRRLGARHVCI